MTKTWYSAWLLIKVVVPTSKFDLGVLAAVVLYLNPLPLWLMLKTPDRAKDCCCRKYYKHANLVTSLKASVKFTMNSNEFCVGIRRAFENFCSAHIPTTNLTVLMVLCLPFVSWSWTSGMFSFTGTACNEGVGEILILLIMHSEWVMMQRE